MFCKDCKSRVKYGCCQIKEIHVPRKQEACKDFKPKK